MSNTLKHAFLLFIWVLSLPGMAVGYFSTSYYYLEREDPNLALGRAYQLVVFFNIGFWPALLATICFFAVLGSKNFSLKMKLSALAAVLLAWVGISMFFYVA
jgi:hypothetical protein